MILLVSSSTRCSRLSPLAVCAGVLLPLIISLPTKAQSDEPLEPYPYTTTFYAHVGGSSDGSTTGGLGFLEVLGKSQRFALGLDFGIEGKREDQTYGSESIGNSYSFNMLIGLPVFYSEMFRIVPFGLLGARTYKTTCPTGGSYLGYRCYADYTPQQHWKINYGGGAILNFNRVAVGVRASGESLAGIAGFSL